MMTEPKGTHTYTSVQTFILNFKTSIKSYEEDTLFIKQQKHVKLEI